MKRILLVLVSTLSVVVSGTLLTLPGQAVPQLGAVASMPSTQNSTYDGIEVVHDEGGALVRWDVPDDVTEGDARTEFAIDGARVVPSLNQDTGTYEVYLPGERDLKATQVSVMRSSQTLAGKQTGPKTATTTRTLPAQPKRSVKKDPGTPGKYRTTSFTYTLPAVKLSYPRKVEMRAQVVLPQGAKSKRPVVLFLHGRHATCYQKSQQLLDWPCPAGSKQIPSYRGYRHTQQLLASQGFATISISANGINGQDWDSIDGGAQERAELVHAHLQALAQWQDGKKVQSVAQPRLRGVLNLRKVLTVGHSRGGEGVSRAAIRAKKSDPYRIQGQVLLAPTDFAAQVSVGTPTSVILPLCDGDVSDLQGQMYVDRGRRIASGDGILRSSVLMFGANHNYFNTAWTPGATAAPADDDWSDLTDPICGAKSSARLSAKQQRQAGSVYIAAAAHAFLRQDSQALQLLNGTAVKAQSAGQARVFSHAVGGKRKVIVSPERTARPKASRGMTVKACRGDGASIQKGPRCFASPSPHWTPLQEISSMPLEQWQRLSWKKKNARYTMRDIPTFKKNQQVFTMRVITPLSQRAPKVDLIVRDTRGRKVTLKPDRQPSRLPHSPMVQHAWAQELQFRLPAKTKVDVTKLSSMTLRGRSASGTLVLLDVSGLKSGLSTSQASNRSVARFDAPRRVRVQLNPGATPTIKIPLRNSFTKTAQVWVQTLNPHTYEFDGQLETVRPGQRSLTVALPNLHDDVYRDPDLDETGLNIVTQVFAMRNAVVDGYAAEVEAISSLTRPTVQVVDSAVTVQSGKVLRWEFELSAPVGHDLWFPVQVQAVSSQLRVEDLLPSWVTKYADRPKKKLLSSLDLQLNVEFAAYSTRAYLEIPLRKNPYLTKNRKAALEVLVGEYAPGDIELTAKVTPLN